MSLEAYAEIELDTSQPVLSVVHAKQYDTVRRVQAHLIFSGSKWYVPENNVYAVVSYKKVDARTGSDRVGGFYDRTDDGDHSVQAVTVDSEDRSIIYIALDRNMLTTACTVNVEIIFYDSITADRLSCFAFQVVVEEAAVRELDVASNPYFNILSQQIANALDAELKLAGITASAEQLDPGAIPTAVMEGSMAAPGDHYNIKIGVPSMPALTASATKLAPDATPSATITGGETATDPYNIVLGIPSMPALTASVNALKPGASPTAELTGGTEPGEDYQLKLGIPVMPGMTSSATKLAPNAAPTATLTGGTTASDPYNLAIGVPSMPELTVEVSALKPGATPTAAISGGTSAGQAYKISLGIPVMPGMTASATKLAPGANPTATLTGGATASDPYKLAIGVPSMPTVSAAMTSLDPGSAPSVAVTGGQTAGEAYQFTFGLPRNGTVNPSSAVYAYALSTDGQQVPSGSDVWKSSVAALGDSIAIRGKYVWTRCQYLWEDGFTSTVYSVAYNGLDSSQSTDNTLSDESTKPVQNKIVKAAVDAKLDAPSDLTRYGLIRRIKQTSTDTYITDYATMGVDFGSFTFNFTLLATDWNEKALTITDSYLSTTSAYSYIISPKSSSFQEYVDCGIYADDISTNGELVFHCEEVPAHDLNVQVLRMVTKAL